MDVEYREKAACPHIRCGQTRARLRDEAPMLRAGRGRLRDCEGALCGGRAVSRSGHRGRSLRPQAATSENLEQPRAAELAHRTGVLTVPPASRVNRDRLQRAGAGDWRSLDPRASTAPTC
jgi:hypothetical protein